MSDPILKILIADDEAPARNRLRELLADMSAINIIAEAKNGLDALHLANDYRPDIVLLDIRMPRMDGIEAAQHLQKMDSPPAIIFTTAFDSYAMQAFDMQAVDYLLKPIRLERLQAAGAAVLDDVRAVGGERGVVRAARARRAARPLRRWCLGHRSCGSRPERRRPQ